MAEDDGTSHSKHPTFFVEAGSVGSHKEQGELVVTAGRVISPGCNACQYRDQVVKGLENMWFLEKHLREA